MSLKSLTLPRFAITRDISEVFEGNVAVNETYLGGHWKDEYLSLKRDHPRAKHGLGSGKQADFGILCGHGKVWAEPIDSVEAKQQPSRILNQMKKGLVSFQIRGTDMPTLPPTVVSIAW
jgi:hypothetical protein